LAFAYSISLLVLLPISANVDDKDFIGQVNLALVHVVQHFLCPFCPDLFISGVAKETDTDDDFPSRVKRLCAS